MTGTDAGVRAPLLATAAGTAAVTALGLIDALTGATLLGALAIGAFIAALAAPRRAVALVVAYAVVWVVLLGAPEHFTATHWFRMALVAGAGGVAVTAATMRERYQEALRHSARIADVSQRALLGQLPTVAGTELAVRYLSSDADALVGGDVYDVADTEWGLRLFVADMCGHGLEVVNGSGVLLQAFRRAAHASADVAAVAAQIDRDFSVSLTSPAATFATGVIVQVTDRQVVVANCGHHDPLLVRRERHQWLTPLRRTTPFGLGPEPESVRFAVGPGDRILLYTDGLVEARGHDDGAFDLIATVPTLRRAASARAAVDEVVARVRQHVGGQLRDDIVVLLARLEPRP